MDPTSYRPGFLKNVKVMFDMRDVVDDVQGASGVRAIVSSGNVSGWGTRRLLEIRDLGDTDVPRPALLPRSDADVVTDTGDNLADMGRRTWKHAKSHTGRLVQSPPSYLKGLFGRDPKYVDVMACPIYMACVTPIPDGHPRRPCTGGSAIPGPSLTRTATPRPARGPPPDAAADPS